jgi:hypothetical protein
MKNNGGIANSLFSYKINYSTNEPDNLMLLDYAIIEGQSYKIPQRIPSGYIEFGIDDFNISKEN